MHSLIKSFLVLSVILFASNLSFGQFITKWDTRIEGKTDSMSIEIPINEDYTYNYDVDWESDGVWDTTGVNGTIEHKYDTSGVYEVSIRGQFPVIYFGGSNSNDRQKIVDVIKWGDNEWLSFDRSFESCSNLIITATDAPVLSNVSSMRRMFLYATVLNGDFSNWDVSKVTTMEAMFLFAESFNGDLSKWNVSNVSNMYQMFFGAHSFSSDLSKWDVSSVTTMSSMFRQATSFSSDLSDWDVSNVEDMSLMFYWARTFNGDLSKWDVSNVTDMYGVFSGARSFNSDLSDWDVSSVTNMDEMFSGAVEFNSDLSRWDVSNVTDMGRMFDTALSFNSDISNWDVSKVKDMRSMFLEARSFSCNLGRWNLKGMVNSNFDEGISRKDGIKGMLISSGMKRSDYDNTLYGWAKSQNTPDSLYLTASGGIYFCNSNMERLYLIDSLDWIIKGDSRDCVEITKQVNDKCYVGVEQFIQDREGSVNDFITFLDTTGHIICTLLPRGNKLGKVSTSVFKSSGTRETSFPVMNRDVTVTSELEPTLPLKIRVYYTNEELAALKAADTTITEISNLAFSRSEQGCSGVFASDSEFIEQTGSGFYSDSLGIYVETEVSSLGTFYLHGDQLMTALDSEQSNEKFDIQLSPNPVSDILRLSKGVKYSIHNITGARVLSGEGSYINVARLTDGVYYIRLEGKRTKKFVKL